MNLAAKESPIGVDRLATLDEVRSAMSCSHRRTFKLAGAAAGTLSEF